MKDVMIAEVSQRHFNYVESTQQLGKDLDLSIKVNYLDMYFGFPWNTKKYKIVLEGEEKQIEKFKMLYEDMF